MKFLVLTSLVFLVGCGGPIKPTIVSGNNLSTEHGTASLEDALLGAKEHCQSVGMDVKLTRSDCPYRCMSSFECVPRS